MLAQVKATCYRCGRTDLPCNSAYCGNQGTGRDSFVNIEAQNQANRESNKRWLDEQAERNRKQLEDYSNLGREFMDAFNEAIGGGSTRDSGGMSKAKTHRCVDCNIILTSEILANDHRHCTSCYQEVTTIKEEPVYVRPSNVNIVETTSDYRNNTYNPPFEPYEDTSTYDLLKLSDLDFKALLDSANDYVNENNFSVVESSSDTLTSLIGNGMTSDTRRAADGVLPPGYEFVPNEGDFMGLGRFQRLPDELSEKQLALFKQRMDVYSELKDVNADPAKWIDFAADDLSKGVSAGGLIIQKKYYEAMLSRAIADARVLKSDGNVVAVDPRTGEKRQLREGDLLYKDERILTDSAARIKLGEYNEGNNVVFLSGNTRFDVKDKHQPRPQGDNHPTDLKPSELRQEINNESTWDGGASEVFEVKVPNWVIGVRG